MPEAWRIEAGRKGGAAGRGKSKSAEHRTAIARAKRGYVTPPSTKAKLSEKVAQAHADGRLVGRIGKGQNGRSSLELRIARAFDHAGFMYEWHVPIGRYCVDFLVEGWLVVEANGCWWHRCKECGYKDEIRKRFRDSRRYRSLRSRGYEVVVIWEHDLKEVMPCPV